MQCCIVLQLQFVHTVQYTLQRIISKTIVHQFSVAIIRGTGDEQFGQDHVTQDSSWATANCVSFECLASQKACSKHRFENMVSFSGAILTLYHAIYHTFSIFQKYNCMKQYLIYYVNCVSGDRKSSWLTLLLFVTLNKSIFNELLFQNN